MAEALTPTAHAQRELLAWLIVAFRAPEPEGLRQLLAADVPSWSRAIDMEPPSETLPPEDAATDLADALETEYVRLFVNAPQGPVAYLEAAAHLPTGDAEAIPRFLTELGDELSTAGLSPAPDAGLATDHLTILLERLYYLGDGLARPAATHPFTLRFLSSWLPQWHQTLEAAQPPAFYRYAARLLLGVLELDLDRGEHRGERETSRAR